TMMRARSRIVCSQTRSGWASRLLPDVVPAQVRNCALGPGRRGENLFHRLAERRAEGLRGVDADDAEFAREEFQFLQRKGEALVLGMAVDIGVKLRRKE